MEANQKFRDELSFLYFRYEEPAMPQPMHSPRRLRQKLARLARGGGRGRQGEVYGWRRRGTPGRELPHSRLET